MRLSFAPRIACLLFALFAAAPLTAMAVSVPVCPSGAVCIDESSEGQPPTVTTDSPSFVSATVTPVPNSPETWDITVIMQGALVSLGAPRGLELIEPSNGLKSDSFSLVSAFSDGGAEFHFRLASDDESHIFDNAPFCPTFCSQELETGMFQLAISGLAASSGSFDVYLKSDLEVVPQARTLILLLIGALAGLTPWARRRLSTRMR
jgi:hypothetical protein